MEVSPEVEAARKRLLDEINSIVLDGRPSEDYTNRVKWIFTEMITRPCGMTEAFAAAGYKDPQQAWTYMFGKYPQLSLLYQQVKDLAGQLLGRPKFSHNAQAWDSPEVLAAHQAGLLYDPDRDMPARPSLRQFRWEYLGTPTPEHQVAAVRALEDPTNLYVFIFGPPGMGKDSLAGQYVLWEAIHREPVAWFMESEDFSKRRLRRIEPYLTSPDIYKTAPKIPGAQVPTRSMIYDWGPFAWKQGMLTPAGVEVPRPKWTQSEKYFVSMEPEEADPNLWATGVGGATYGSRIQTAVLSDLWSPDGMVQPAVLEKQFNFVKETLDTRLDDDGRLVLLGTMLPWQNNYERLVDEYTDGAVIIDEDEYMTKWSNGACVVKIKAITTDSATGEQASYWPVKFPLHDLIEITYGDGRVEELRTSETPPEDILALENRQRSGEIKTLRRRRGLTERRRRDPIKFRATFQQESVATEYGDFTDQVFELALDPARSFGQYDPSETLVLGVDPAKTYGAAWVLWAVNRRAGTIALVDFAFHQNLGFEGIKSKLVVEPITRYQPTWMAYETNKHAFVLEDSIITSFLSDYGVRVHEHRTSGSNRGDVASLASLMRARVIRLPAAARSDTVKLQLFVDHFKAFDLSTLSQGRRSRPGQKTHTPDDVALAAWIGSTKARDLLEGKEQRSTSGIGRAVPSVVAERWEQYKADQRRREAHTKIGDHRAGSTISGHDIATMLATSHVGER